MSEENVVVEETPETPELVEENTEGTSPESIEDTETAEEAEAIDWANLELKNTEGVKKLSEYTQEEAKAFFQKGTDYDRKVKQLEELRNNPNLKYMNDYMKQSGFDDPELFVRELKITSKTAEYIEDGMSEDKARKAAEEFVGKPTENKTDKEIADFLEWQSSKVKAGKFSEKIDADNIPEEVINSFNSGTPLKEAYMDYMLDNIKTSTEQATIKKIADNKNKSTKIVEGTTVPEAKLSAEQIENTLNSMSGREKVKWIDKNYELIEKSGYFKNF